MRQQFREGEEPKKRRQGTLPRVTGSQKEHLDRDVLTDTAIDPADFWGPEEFGLQGRDLKSKRP